MVLSLRSLGAPIMATLMLTSCSCEEKKAAGDAGTNVPDANMDAGPDAGHGPSDPEINWVEIPAGSFTFGSPPGTPCQGPTMEKEVPVSLTRPFVMSKFEVTQRQWAKLGFSVPPLLPKCDDCPITFLNWFEALAWCNALSRFEGLEECYDLSTCDGEIGNGCPEGFGLCGGPVTEGNAYHCTGKTRKYDSMYGCTGYRLPTSPEWEYAAKAGTTANTYNGDVTTDTSTGCVEDPVLDDIAWYCFNSGYMNGSGSWSIDSLEMLRCVGLKQPNPFGLYDMLGNAGEWVDCVSTGFSLDDNEGKPGEALVDPMGAEEAQDGRGDVRGGWFSRVACRSRSATQFDDARAIRSSPYGFRPVRTLPAPAPDAGSGDSGAK
jgi:formylglycine-generating enzyme